MGPLDKGLLPMALQTTDHRMVRHLMDRRHQWYLWLIAQLIVWLLVDHQITVEKW